MSICDDHDDDVEICFVKGWWWGDRVGDYYGCSNYVWKML